MRPYISLRQTEAHLLARSKPAFCPHISQKLKKTELFPQKHMQNEFFLCYSIEEKRHACYYYVMHVLMLMIRTFRNKTTEGIWEKRFQKHIPPNIQKQGAKKLLYLDRVCSLDEIRLAPGNKLKTLGGDRAGQYSIWINQQWRICFNWDYESNDSYNVEITDYHR